MGGTLSTALVLSGGIHMVWVERLMNVTNQSQASLHL
jgi:hypothetical protein